ncbi:MAG: S8 family serine peptidase [Armatimonadetes bacterium]|nr:S8 family serine peptidase [Armatimonadota bacterium]MDE2205974.1 S8 family serine peptidase [Armatimonadota bacterium]
MKRAQQSARWAWAPLAAAVFGLSIMAAYSQTQPNTVPGEIILYMQPGTPQDTVNTVAASVSPLSVTPLLMKDCYVIWLPTNRQTPAETSSAVATLKQFPSVRYADISHLYTLYGQSSGDIPNDPDYAPDQWDMPLINMPQAWALEKGAPNVNVGWIDSGYDLTHVDTKGQFLPDSYDTADNSTNINADAGADHGVSTSGIAIALTNNGIGAAGIDWENIKCLGIKAHKIGAPAESVDTPGILSGYAYILSRVQQDHIVAVNMSYGYSGGDPSNTNDPQYQGILALVNAGVAMIAAAGNDGIEDSGTNLPAAYPFVVSVSAIGPTKALAYYSSYGKVELAAPGGSQITGPNDPNGCFVLKQGSLYAFEQGTSFAAPHVTAVTALLMSIPGVTAAKAIKVMEETANSTGLGTLPDAHFGYGILDAYAALNKVAVQASIVNPQGVDPATGLPTDLSNTAPPVATFKPRLTFSLVNVAPANVTITIDGTPAPASDIQNATFVGDSTSANPNYTMQIRHQFPLSAPFQHTITVTGVGVGGGATVTASRIITLTPHVFLPGTSLVSIPYFESAADSPTGAFRQPKQLLGSSSGLARWVTLPTSTGNAGQYATYGPGASGENPAYSSFTPPDVTTTIDQAEALGLPTDVRPLGLGYFLQSPASIEVDTNGKTYDNRPIVIPLHEGWNLIGDPFNYVVPFNALQVQMADGSRVSIGSAADQGSILPDIYTLSNGSYTFATLPGGSLLPWQGHWVYVYPKNPASPSLAPTISLVVPPTAQAGSGTGNAVVLHPQTAGQTLGAPVSTGWKLQLDATSGTLHDANNFIGMSGQATVGRDITKVPKPPMLSPNVTLGVLRPNDGSALYAQDLEPFGAAHTWNVIVSSTQKNATVTVTWPNIQSVPRSYSLLLTDKTSGDQVQMRHAGSYQFNTGPQAASRTFTITAAPVAPGAPMAITSVFVDPARMVNGRSVGLYDIRYNLTRAAQVSVTVMANGRTVAQVAPGRAVLAGSNDTTWNGRDSAGRTLPAGLYMVQISAVTSDGQVARTVAPMVITGR